MLAHNQGSVLNQSRIASALGVANPTVDRYIDLLVDLQLARLCGWWAATWANGWSASPKVYVRDSGLLHGLLELETLNHLLGHPVCGLSYEGHCIENLIQGLRECVLYLHGTHQPRNSAAWSLGVGERRDGYLRDCKGLQWVS